MTYIAIGLKSFYASAECADRKLDPLTTNLGVSVRKVAAWEHGKAVPDENVCERILNLRKDQG